MSVLNRELFKIFSNPRHQTIEDIVAVGGVLEPEILQFAYDHGVFPWPHEGYPLLWFAPAKRGVIDFENFHLPKSFQKWMKKNHENYHVEVNQQFSEVVRQCRIQKRQGQKGSWINPDIEKAYFELHQKGLALSLEIYRGEKLVGGIYGVSSQKYFSCESMFHLESETSKLALFHLVEYLKSKNHQWMDIQMVTSVCENFGGYLIAKNEFLKRIGL